MVMVPVVSVACVAVGLIDFNPSVQRFHLQRCRAYLDFCYELGARNLLLVLGDREAGSGVPHHIGQLFRDRILVDRHRHSPQGLASTHRPIEAGPIVANDDQPVASRESEVGQPRSEALDLAGRGWGMTSPNPMVGAVLVRDGGFTEIPPGTLTAAAWFASTRRAMTRPGQAAGGAVQ